MGMFYYCYFYSTIYMTQTIHYLIIFSMLIVLFAQASYLMWGPEMKRMRHQDLALHLRTLTSKLSSTLMRPLTMV